MSAGGREGDEPLLGREIHDPEPGRSIGVSLELLVDGSRGREVFEAADALLDPFHYGGGVTTYDGLALGTPIVTMPSRYQRGRYTLGCYRRMDVLDCVASSAERYVELALRLGTDRDYRQSVKEKILKSNAVLFEDLGAVREHEDFFDQAILTVVGLTCRMSMGTSGTANREIWMTR